MAVLDSEITEAMRFVPVETIVRARSVLGAEVIRIHPGADALYGLVIAEAVKVRAILAGNTIGSVTLSDTFQLVSLLYNARLVELEDGVGVDLLQQLQSAIAIADKLALSYSVAPAAHYRLGLRDGLKLVTSLARFFGADIVDALGLDDAMIARALAQAGLTDGLGLEPVLAPKLLFHVTLEDGVHLDPEDEIKMLFNPTMLEGVAIRAGYLEPNGSFTTWAMNTRNGAVTEYADYAFNSFARVGNQYLGASEEGLFLLQGDDDDGDDIIARIKGGFLQFGGVQLSRLKEAYIAARGGGDWVLRIRTGSGELYNYGVSTRSMVTTRVNMGKGMRARYFAFELLSEGQDFDLDNLEFVPIVVQRRVG